MADALVASMMLKLNDQLSSPLDNLIATIDKFSAVIDRLAGVADKLNFNGIGNKATEAFDAATKEADALARAIWAVETPIEAVEKRSVGLIERFRQMSAAGADMMRRTGAAGMDMLGRAGNAVMAPARGVFGAANHFSESGSNLINRGFGAAVEGFAVYEPIKAFAEWNDQLRQIAITEGLHGDALETEVKFLDRFFRHDAAMSGQTTHSIAHAYHELLGQGLKRSQLLEAIGQHSMVATAYGLDANDLGPLTGALLQNAKVPTKDIGDVLARMAFLAQHGNFKLTDMSAELPGALGALANLGVTGGSAAVMSGAMLEIIRRSASQSGQAAANYFDAISHLTALEPRRAKRLEKMGLNFDMHAILSGAEAQHINPLIAVMDKIQSMTAGKSNTDRAFILSALFGNQQERNAFMALLQHYDEMKSLFDLASSKTHEKLIDDFNERVHDPAMQLQMMGEQVEWVTRALGEGFLPVLQAVNVALAWSSDKLLAWKDAAPTSFKWVTSGLGGLLAFGAALGLLSAIVAFAGKGFVLFGRIVAFPFRILGVLLSPLVRGIQFIGAALTGITAPATVFIFWLALLSAAAFDIYQHWSHFRAFFVDLWAGVRAVFRGAVEAIIGVLTGSVPLMEGGVKRMMKGTRDGFRDGIKIIKHLFYDFGDWVAGWGGEFGKTVQAAIQSKLNFSIDVHTPFGPDTVLGRFFGAHDAAQKSAANATPPAPAPQQVLVHITTDPGSRVASAKSSSPSTTVTTGTNRGKMLAVP